MKVLFGVPPKHHVSLAIEEMEGLTNLNFDCSSTVYGKNEMEASAFSKFFTVIINAIRLIKRMYSFKPDVLYLSSRIEPTAAIRDYIVILFLTLLYYKSVRIIIKSHGSDFSLYDSNSIIYKYIIVPFLLKHVDGWLLLSTEEIETMARHKPHVAHKLYLTTNVVTLVSGIFKNEIFNSFEIPHDKFKIFFSGRMIKQKGCYDIINAVKYLKNKEEFTFIFLGDGKELENLKQTTIDLNISHLFLFLGYIDENKSDALIEHMDLLLFPSYDEGFSMVLFKSVAYGLPVITTRVRASKDYLKENDNVLWVNTNNPKMIAEMIEKLYNEEELRINMSKNNKKLGEKFNRENTAIRLSQILEKITRNT